MPGVAALPDHGPGIPGGGRRAIGAVVGHHEGDQVFRGIVLGFDALNELGDDRLLVSGGDEHRVAAERRGALRPLFSPQCHGHIQQLVEVAQQEQHADGAVDDLQDGQCGHDSLLSRTRQMPR